MYARASNILHTNVLLHLGVGSLTLSECMNVAKAHLESRGVKTLREVPTDEVWGVAIEICRLMMNEALAKKERQL